MKILVIGGTGFIGSQIVNRLAEKGHDVTVFHRGKTKTTHKEIIGAKENLSNFRTEFEKLSPQVVIDVINYTENEANSLVQTFRGVTERLVVLGSQDVYKAFAIIQKKEEGKEDLPISENSQLRSETYYYREYAKDENDFAYNYSKLLVENIVLNQTDISGTILRLPCVYGIGDHKHRFFPYIKRMQDDRPFILIDEDEANWRWTRGYVENIAEAVSLAATEPKAANQIYNVGEKETISVRRWIEAFAEELDWQGELVSVSKENLGKLADKDTNFEQDFIADTNKIRNELNFTEIVSRSNAIKRTIDWETNNPPATIDPNQFDYETEDVIFEKLKN